MGEESTGEEKPIESERDFLEGEGSREAADGWTSLSCDGNKGKQDGLAA